MSWTPIWMAVSGGPKKLRQRIDVKEGHPVVDITFSLNWVFPKIVGFPLKWMVKIMENPIKMDDLGKHPLFSESFQISTWGL